jgi:membrane fusion protein (multidrug efflux system)
MNYRKLLTVLAVAALLGGAALLIAPAGMIKVRAEEKPSLGTLKPETAARADAPKSGVPTAAVESAERETVLRLTGALAADEKSDVASNTNGIVQKVFVERGSMVNEGDILVQVDPTDVQNMLNQGVAGLEELKVRLGIRDEKAAYSVENQPEVKMAKAALNLARVNQDRFMKLYEQDVLPKADYDRVLFECDSAAQRYEQARLQMSQLYQSYLTGQTKLDALRKALEDCSIRAPFSGYVAERLINVGERVSPSPMGKGAAVATILKLDPLRLILTVPQQSVGQITPGQTVSFRVDSLPDRSFAGEIRYVGPSVESNSRSMIVEAMVPNPDHILRPGTFASAEVALPEKSTRLLVPASAILRDNDISKIFVVQDGVAREQVVSTGEVRDGKIEVTGGLAGTETVVTAPDRIHDGDKVS